MTSAAEKAFLIRRGITHVPCSTGLSVLQFDVNNFTTTWVNTAVLYEYFFLSFYDKLQAEQTSIVR